MAGTVNSSGVNRRNFPSMIPIYDLFADEFSRVRLQAEERDEAVEKIEKESDEDKKRKRQNRKIVEDLPVLETEVIEPAGVDLSYTIG